MSGRFAERRAGILSLVPADRASVLLGREVRFRGIRLGVVVDMLVDPPTRRALGYEVLCGDEGRRFLPLAAAEAVADGIEVGSALVLLDDPFYRERAVAFGSLRGSVVRRGAEELGVVCDAIVSADGRFERLVVASGGRERELPLDPTLSFGGERLRPAV